MLGSIRDYYAIFCSDVGIGSDLNQICLVQKLVSGRCFVGLFLVH